MTMDYRIKYSLTVAAAILCCLMASAQGGPQIFNMSFDSWSKSGGAWYPNPKGASGARRVWDSANIN